MTMSFLHTRLILTLLLPLSAAACNLDAAAGSTKKTAQCSPGATLGQSDAGLQLVGLCTTSGEKSRRFSAENASTPAQQAQGMMFRKSLADDAGMIFPFSPPRPASFWMKNTLIPLDIIFIGADGRIESIAENTVPYSFESVKSAGPVIAVLELRGGLTAELGIKPGDLVQWAPRKNTKHK